MSEREILIVTGMSGAGRSTAGNALEDLGWFVVDNIPPQLLNPLVELAEHAGEAIPRVAAIVDIRGGRLLSDVEEAMERLRVSAELRVLFLDATDNELVRRFEAVRRPHPLQGTGTLLDGIGEERRRLSVLRDAADMVLDTSDFNIHQLQNAVTELFGDEQSRELRVTVLSFGFKYGLPTDAEQVADARFIPNPFWVPELRSLTGLDDAVSDYVLTQEGAPEFLDRYLAAMEPVLAGYRRENKRNATIAVGCTGGKHRSVAVAQELARRLDTLPGIAASAKHRDLGRE